MSHFLTRVRAIGLALLVLILIGIIAFAYQVWGYYRSIKNGDISPILQMRLESTVSNIETNQNVTRSDLNAINDPSAPALGDAGAPVTVVEFLDYGCPYCRQAFEPVRELVSDRPQDVRLIIRDFPVEELHPGAVAAAFGARCAQEQGKFWPFHDKLYGLDQRSYTDSDLVTVAKSVGLEMEEWNNCRRSDAILSKVRNDVAAGLGAGVAGTPTFFFNGIRVQGALDRDTLKVLVDYFVKKNQK